jgi:hypothetical protein
MSNHVAARLVLKCSSGLGTLWVLHASFHLWVLWASYFCFSDNDIWLTKSPSRLLLTNLI